MSNLADLAILFWGTLMSAPPTDFHIILVFIVLTLIVLYEGYSRNASFALNLISPFLLVQNGN